MFPGFGSVFPSVTVRSWAADMEKITDQGLLALVASGAGSGLEHLELRGEHCDFIVLCCAGCSCESDSESELLR